VGSVLVLGLLVNWLAGALLAFTIFFYVGAEVMAGDIISTYGKNLGFSLDQTKYFTTFTLIAMLGGYVLGIIAKLADFTPCVLTSTQVAGLQPSIDVGHVAACNVT
jgi:hypothetical protein